MTWLRWPWVSRARMDLTVALLERQMATAVEDRDYWRTRCERLTDAALLRRGEVAGPVFETPAARTDLVKSVFAAASHIGSHIGVPIGPRGPSDGH